MRHARCNLCITCSQERSHQEPTIELTLRCAMAGLAVLTKLAVVLTMYIATPSAHAECFDPSKHLRGGQWNQWVLQLTPGRVARDKVEQVIDEINAARLANDLPLLVYRKAEAIAFGVIEENNSRGPYGVPVADHVLPNHEIFFATFASLAPKQPVVVFLADPLRSNAHLTAAGVPGQTAEFATTLSLDRQGKEFAVKTKWLAQNGSGDRVQFAARYSSADIAGRGSSPSGEDYLRCGMSSVFSVIFRSKPLQTFSFFDLIQTSVIRDFDRQNVEVDLRVQLADPVVHAIFNDPENRFLQLLEVHRVVRIERRQ